MKKMVALLLVLVCVLGLVACSEKDNEDSKTQTEINNNPTTENNEILASASTEGDAEYGCLQELVDSYGFPICLRMTEGMELTKLEISEDYATRYWTSSLSNSPTLHENLTWSIADNHLVISGDWEEEFTINVDTWRATSVLDGKEYRIVIYDENGDVAFSAPF